MSITITCFGIACIISETTIFHVTWSMDMISELEIFKNLEESFNGTQEHLACLAAQTQREIIRFSRYLE